MDVRGHGDDDIVAVEGDVEDAGVVKLDEALVMAASHQDQTM